MQTKIFFFFEQKAPSLTERTQLKHFIKNLFLKEGYQLLSLNVVFCSDDFLIKINRVYLKHNSYTDIITFLLSDPQHPIEAELYISVDRVKDNASSNGSTFKKELHRVIFHGCLHLCGYNDKSSQEIIVIRKAEDAYLRSYLK